MLGTFPSRHSRVNLPDLLNRPPSAEKNLNLALKQPEPEPVTVKEQAKYFVLCFLNALGPSLLDIFLSRMTKEM